VNPRLRLVLIGLAACAAAALAGTWIAAFQSAGEPEREPAPGWSGALRPPGAHVPPFSLRDQDGRRVTADSLRGRGPVVFTFIYSTCEDTCPALVDQVRGALDDTGADMPLLAVSVDPANDTEARAKRFLNERRMTGRATFLLGSRAELAPVWKGYGIQPQTDALDHTAGVVLVDAQGRQRVGFPHDQLTPAALAHDIRRLAR
jgi:protein SCO1